LIQEGREIKRENGFLIAKEFFAASGGRAGI